MLQRLTRLLCAALAMVGLLTATANAAPIVFRLNPPSRLFSGLPNPTVITARFLPNQRFDLQATILADAGQTIASAQFFVDGTAVSPVINTPATAGNRFALASIATNAGLGNLPAFSATFRGYSLAAPGVHLLTVRGTQSNGLTFEANSNFEIANILPRQGRLARNVIYIIGDGMGAAHRTAARLVLNGALQGKSNAPLAMDRAPFTGMVVTHSLNSIVTDSSPGAACFSTGNKSNNNQHGVFPDDTADNFDNPRHEHLGEYLARIQGKSLGIVTTSDVFDATPAAFATHTSNRGAGTGIIDQYLLEGVNNSNLRVLMGGGRRWFLPGPDLTTFPNATGQTLLGTSRATGNDYVLSADIVAGWNVAAGTINPNTNVISQFQGAGFAYAANRTELATMGTPQRLLGLFANGNMNIALDKIAKRRNATVGFAGGRNPVSTNFVVDEYGFPDQPMLDEMTSKALQVLNQNPAGFTLMIEGASIDKQAHNMDSERWILDTIELDRSVEVCRQFAETNPDTLIVITADHECAGVAIIGASTVPNADTGSGASLVRGLQFRSTSGVGAGSTLADNGLRAGVVGTYEAAGFPVYTIGPDGYPTTTDPDRRLLIGYGANADRFEDYLTNALPLRDGQSILSTMIAGLSDYDDAPLNAYPAGGLNRDMAGNFRITGQVADGVAAHTASDIPVSAFGRGSSLFTGVMDNTDVFFRVAQAVLGGGR